MNGILRFAFTLLQRTAASTVSITTRRARAGSCGEFTTDVHRASRALCIQLSRRRFPSRRIDRRLCGTQRARHGFARSRRRVWLAPLSPGGEKTLHSGPHRRGSHVRRGLALSLARRIARRLPESVPPHHANEAPRAKGRRLRSLRRNIGNEQRPDLSHGRRRRSAGSRFGARRNRDGFGMRAATLPGIRPAKRLRRTPAPFLPRRRSAQSGRRCNRAETEIALTRHQWRLIRAAAPTRSAGCFHLHPPSPQARDRRPSAEPQFRAPLETARGNGAPFFRSSRSHRQYGNPLFTPAIRFERPRIQIPRLSGP